MQKPLTLSQQQHLLALIERANAAKVSIDSFIEYLRDEHSAPSNAGWQINDVQMGFVQVQSTAQAPAEAKVG
jgi:hypothetical protein